MLVGLLSRLLDDTNHAAGPVRHHLGNVGACLKLVWSHEGTVLLYYEIESRTRHSVLLLLANGLAMRNLILALHPRIQLLTAIILGPCEI